VPILSFGAGMKQGVIGRRESFADIGASVTAHLGLRPSGIGLSWL
jgi:phosphopentomutase